MDLQTALRNIGLSEAETAVYLALLKLGSSPVSAIKEESRVHRTNIYDLLERLLNKGLVNYVIKNNVKYFNTTEPVKLLDYIKEKEDTVKDILPQLTQLTKFHKDQIKVEVYKGVEGVKTILNDVLRVGKDYVIFGIDETMFKEKLGPFMDQFFRKEKKLGFKERILTRDNVEFVYEYDTAMYRYLPKESFNPTPTYVYGENVAILIWEPFSVIKIQNAALADSYAKYFEMLWNLAKEKPKENRNKEK